VSRKRVNKIIENVLFQPPPPSVKFYIIGFVFSGVVEIRVFVVVVCINLCLDGDVLCVDVNIKIGLLTW
jgi:hypothetical protein